MVGHIPLEDGIGVRVPGRQQVTEGERSAQRQRAAGTNDKCSRTRRSERGGARRSREIHQLADICDRVPGRQQVGFTKFISLTLQS